MPKYTVTAAALVHAARQAYKAKNLAAQRPEISKGQCRYFYVGDDSCGCAVGVGLPREAREDFTTTCSVLGGMRFNDAQISGLSSLLEIKDANKVDIELMQNVHDYWCRQPLYKKAEEEFLAVLSRCERQVKEHKLCK